MVQRGFIDSQGNGNDGLLFQFDNCSQTVGIGLLICFYNMLIRVDRHTFITLLPVS